MNTDNANAAPAINATEEPKPVDAKVDEAAPVVATGEPPKPAEGAEQKPEQKVTETNAVPQPQLGMPMFKRRADPGKAKVHRRLNDVLLIMSVHTVQYDSQSEIPGRCEDWLLIPVKQYPLINWRFLFGGTGTTLAPLTLIERETGAAVLVRNMKRTLNRRPLGGPGGMMGGAGFAEVQRFQEALAALQKAEKEAAAMAVAEGTGGGGTANGIRGADSNAAIPPTPKNEDLENVKHRQLPGDGGALTSSLPNINIKLADAAVTTPAPSSPIQNDSKRPAAEPSAKVAGNLPALKEEEELKGKTEKAQGDGEAELKADNDEMDVDKPVEKEEEPVVQEVIDPRTAPENKDIGLHCWIMGTLQSEVEHAYARIQELIESAIKDFEQWEEEQENLSDDEEAEVDHEEKDKDIVMDGGEGTQSPNEAKKAIDINL